MRTTLELRNPLLREAKKRAAAEGRTLASVVEEALERMQGRGFDRFATARL